MHTILNQAFIFLTILSHPHTPFLLFSAFTLTPLTLTLTPLISLTSSSTSLFRPTFNLLNMNKNHMLSQLFPILSIYLSSQSIFLPHNTHASSNRRRQSSRLQCRAPTSIEVKRCSDWNVATLQFHFCPTLHLAALQEYSVASPSSSRLILKIAS